MLNLRGNSSPNKKAEALIRDFGLYFCSVQAQFIDSQLTRYS